MIILVLGVALFAATHLLTLVPKMKADAVARFGRASYGAAFGVVSLLALAVIVLGWRSSAFVPVYAPPAWGRYANYVLTLIGFLCLGVFLFRGTLRQSLRFPLAIAVLFWGTGHLLANGDLAGLLLFGGFMTYAALHIGLGAVQGVRPSVEIRSGHDLLSLLAGVALYGVMVQLHAALIGVPIFVLTR